MLEAIFETIRGKRREVARSLNEQYEEMVSALASNDEIDVIFLAEVLDKLGKTETDLEQDVSNVVARAPKQAELKRLKEYAASLPKLNAARDKAIADLEAALEQFATIAEDLKQ